MSISVQTCFLRYALGAPVGLAVQEPAKPAAPAAAAVVIPDTPAGKGLKEFVASFNAGGEKRRAWVEERTTMGKDGCDQHPSAGRRGSRTSTVR